MNEAEQWLLEWHERRPGVTARHFASGRPSSYEWLASLVSPGDRALDLACGDGYLLELLLARGAAEGTGVDMSVGELGAARARLGDRARLVQARAQELPFADGAFDVVTCHLAFMLMSSVDEVTAEIRRVLRPGGSFGAIVGGADGNQDVWSRIRARLSKIEFVGPRIGDKRTYTQAGLRAFLSGFSDVVIEPFVVDLSGPPERIWSLFVDSYNFEMMTPDAVADLEASIQLDCNALIQPDGVVPCSMGLWAVRATL